MWADLNRFRCSRTHTPGPLTAGNLARMASDPSQNYLTATKTECVQGIMYLAVAILGTAKSLDPEVREALEEIAKRASGALGPQNFYQTTTILEKLRTP
jgi:hypothetical protein